MKKDIALIGGLFLVIIALLFFGNGFTSTGLVNRKSSTGSTPAANLGNQVEIQIKNFRLHAAVADSADERKIGLSKRDGLALDWGLLFIFDKKGLYSIWMKDMRFAIDIIWISEDKRIVDIVQNAAAEPSKKDKDLTIYTPRADAKYILEINAGLASLNNLQIGDVVEFKQ